MEVIEKNSSGEKVLDIQRRLKLLGYELGTAEIDGIFGVETENAIRKFQQDRGLLVTGVMDDETWQELVDAGCRLGERMLYLKYPPFRGDDVRVIQVCLKTLGFYPYDENGIFCEKTQRALVEFQKNMNIADDGIVGKETIHKLKNLERIIVSRESSNFPLIQNPGEGKKLQENRIILDYSDNIEDMKGSGEYLNEKIYICGSIVNYCRDMLIQNGIETFVSIGSGEKQNVFLYDRVEYINKNNADLLISIDLNYSVEKNANGCSCFYFKGLKSYSIEGYRVANLIQDKIVSNLKVLDCRVHGTNRAILKVTNPTSVLVEPAFISNLREREKLKKSSYQKRISENIVEAILEYLNE
ncbi:MAG: peptidoglycan-binding protein [Actinomycetota bacterium]|nr:peptidoglycan-binding protein [Actinomycetota bacterium]